MPTWQSYLDTQAERFLQEYFEYLRIPSISALPAHAADVQKAAEWVARRMIAAGIEGVRILPTGGHPVVYGDWLHAPGKPTVLLYGHFDVQPVDPVKLWTNPPFEPTIRDGRVYARGASDNKGNMLPTLLATEALLQTKGALPLNVKYLFEGQEEIGSPQLPAFVAANRDLLTCDMIVSSDSGQLSETDPALNVGLRGICSIQIDIKGAKGDLHSGIFGGAVQNPLNALAALIASMHTADGKVAVEGFYDAVVPLSADDRARLARVPLDEDKYRADLGVTELYGEAGYTTLERAWARPTLDVNGMWGGFQGEGVKTVIASEAHAKITCRLVANQEPAKVVKLLERHVKRHTPPGVTATVTPGGSLGWPYLMPADHPGNQAAKAVLTELYGKEPYYIMTGGSVPVVPVFFRELGVYTVSFGFGLDDEGFHAPDEFFRLENFTRAQKAFCMLLEQLAQQ